MRRSPYPQIPVDEARALVIENVAPLPPETRRFDDTADMVLAEPVHAREPMPPFAASAKDGYAVVAADGTGHRDLVGEATAGRLAGIHVQPGTAARITTGAPLPPGADAVVMVEDTRADGDGVWIGKAVASGDDVRPVGQDYEAGTEILPAGTTLGPAEIGLAASVGATELRVHRRPRVAVFGSGDELVPPDAEPAPGQIRDSNQFAMAAAVRAAGAEVIQSGVIRDATDDLAVLAAAIEVADAVVTSGGVSMGHRDLIKPWLAEHGEIVFGRVRVKPGKPMTFAQVGGTPVFALPGFPVSTMVSFELFARPALRRMAGHQRVDRPIWRVRLAHDVSHPADRTEFQRAVVVMESGRPTARTTGFQGSGRLLSLSGANALLRFPEGTGATAAGTEVEAIMLGPVFKATSGS